MICDHCTDRGMCCRYIELPLARELSQDEMNWVNLHLGVSMKTAATVRIEIACSALTEDGLCSLFGAAERPIMCSVWPDDVENQAPPGCAYLNKELVEQWPVLSQ